MAEYFRDFCFTLNNYTDEEVQELRDVMQHKSCVYGVFGYETAPTTGTQHLQCYIYWKNEKTLSAARKKLPKRISKFAPRYRDGHPDVAANYCKKGEQPHEEWETLHLTGPNYGKNARYEEFGTCPKQGKRNDIVEIREVVKDTGRMRDVMNRATSLQSAKFAEMYLKYHEQPRNWQPEVIWIHGPTGVGKSRMAREIVGDDYYTSMDTSRWWDGYDGHECLIIDDFRTDFCTWSQFLKMTDRYEWRVETKGGTRQLRAKKIVITCPEPPDVVFGRWTGEDIQQGLRRISQIILLVG